MSRSIHTRPPRIRAPSRLRAPFAPRGAGDLATCDRTAGTLKAAGIVVTPAPAMPLRADAPTPLPRVRASRPRAGYFHPAGRAAVLAALRLAGEVGTYGLRSVALVRAPSGAGGRLCLGRLRPPGEILLYEQPLPPWTLPGRPAPAEADRLARAGALLTPAAGGAQTIVAWPGDTLRDFMLFDVLLHEVGHHIVQQYTGKRTVRVRRTKDHEAFAERFAARCRSRYRTVLPTW